jgi:hypothetical protein
VSPHRPQTPPELTPEFQPWVRETIDRFQPKFQEQESYRRLDDLDDEEARIEHDTWKALEKAVEKAAANFEIDPSALRGKSG